MSDSRVLAEKMLKTYFTTFDYPFTHHQLNSYDQFIANDIPAIIKYSNPILLLQEKLGNTDEYKYRVEIFIGGLNGDQFYIGTPTVSLKNETEVRVLYPNEARLRNLTYATNIEADVVIRLTFMSYVDNKLVPTVVLMDPKDEKYAYLGRIPLCKLPVMLHSRYCLLRDKPSTFLQEVGESPYDYGGYFIIDGSEKVLITQQEQAYNTLYISKQNDPAVEMYSSIQCLNAQTREIKRIAFSYMRNVNTIQVSIPYVRKAVPLFVLFRALGINTDEDILRLIFPIEENVETKILAPLLHESILDAGPFLDQYSAIQYIKVLTKGFSEAHVYDILLNQLFIHVENKPMNKALFLADCVRKILRVHANVDTPTDRDDIRNQRCLTSGFLTRLLFQNVYKRWAKQVTIMIDKEYKYNKTIYSGSDFMNLFLPGNIGTFFQVGLMTEGITRGFKGKWSVGVEDKAGIIQPLSRLSYLDFLSHCRRVVLDFDTGMKLQGPRRLHTTQFGYFCTSETPGGSSIGITKNLSILTAISLAMDTIPFISWLFKTMQILYVNDLTPLMLKVAVPVYVNSGIVGFSLKPQELVAVCKLFKRTGCLPAYSSISFNIRERNVSFYFDEGRPVRPLIFVEHGAYPTEKIKAAKSWRNLVLGSLPANKDIEITSSIFRDPFVGKERVSAEDYVNLLRPHEGAIEYVDPYESNEAFIAMYPELIKRESTHVELHPSTMLGLLTSMIPFPNHNQSPRNQLSCSQSKQGISIPFTNYKNRFDNQTHILCYGEAPLVRTLYYDYAADGKIGYGHNLILAMGCFTGYNQEDGIVFNADSFQRGMFRNMTYRSYETFEEDDKQANTKTRVANPLSIPGWTRLRAGVDYKKLDERGIIKKGETVDENTVLVARYIQNQTGEMADASLTAQVWTSGTVEEVSVTVNNAGLSIVKVRVIQDREPELGDKFCLTDDHDVLTKERGWVPINNVTLDDKVAQLNREKNTMEYVHPKELFVFDHDADMYEVESQGLSLKTTMNHRMYIREKHTYNLIEAKDILTKDVYYKGIDNEIFVESGNGKITNYKGKVYCISVPSEVFLVRRNGKIVYTGNSNRHGQKGTMGMLIPAADMPRSASGLVPDMMMNPHAIPSRMTMAQLLESLLGKAACLEGFIGDATAFMNEGGVEESIGKVLEKNGIQKYGEELFYDGTTGTMIPTSIFVGNVYTMRLKHMVEDKWNARGEGRKEQRTHQPTGGRGNQGGLRIGEMERDALLGHGISEFIRESYMKRSDGTIMTICNGCGTVPIYNEKEKFYFCSLCDGPALFAGENASNLEILPSLKRSLTSFSSVELPYAFEVLNKEMNTYMNMYMRYLTTKDVTHLRKTPLRGLNKEEVTKLLSEELIARILEDTSEPPEIPTEVTITADQLKTLGLADEDEDIPQITIATIKKTIDAAVKANIAEDAILQGVPQAQAQVQADEEADDDQISTIVSEPPLAESIVETQEPFVMVPMVPLVRQNAQVVRSQIPNVPPTLVVDTSKQAMDAEGIDEFKPRSILRSPNSPSRFSRSRSNSNASQTFSINKLGSDDTPSMPTGGRINIVKEQ